MTRKLKLRGQIVKTKRAEVVRKSQFQDTGVKLKQVKWNPCYESHVSVSGHKNIDVTQF